MENRKKNIEHPAIISLTKILRLVNSGQKRIIRNELLINRANPSKYLKMYDFLLKKLDIPSVGTLKQQLIDHEIVSYNELSGVANTLFEKILKILKDHENTPSLSRQIHDLIADIKFLMRNEFRKEIEAKITLAKSLAEHADRPELLIEIISLEYSFLLLHNRSHLIKHLNEFEQHLEMVKSIYINYLHLQSLAYQLIYLHQTQRFENSEAFKSIKSFVLAPPHPAILNSFRYMRLFYAIRANFHLLSSFDKSLNPEERASRLLLTKDNLKKIALLYEQPKYQHFRTEEPTWFLIDTTRYLFYCTLNNEKEEFDRYITNLAKMDNDADNLRSNIYLYLQFYSVNCLFEESKSYILSFGIEEKLEKMQNLIEESKIIILYNFIVEIYFYNENWEKALEWACKIIYSFDKDLRADLKFFAGMIEIIARAELGQLTNHKNPTIFIDNLKRKDKYKFQTKDIYQETLRMLKSLSNAGGRLPAKKMLEWKTALEGLVQKNSTYQNFYMIVDWAAFRSKKDVKLIEIAKSRRVMVDKIG